MSHFPFSSSSIPCHLSLHSLFFLDFFLRGVFYLFIFIVFYFTILYWRWEWGSGRGTRVHPWRMHVDVCTLYFVVLLANIILPSHIRSFFRIGSNFCSFYFFPLFTSFTFVFLIVQSQLHIWVN